MPSHTPGKDSHNASFDLNRESLSPAGIPKSDLSLAEVVELIRSEAKGLPFSPERLRALAWQVESVTVNANPRSIVPLMAAVFWFNGQLISRDQGLSIDPLIRKAAELALITQGGEKRELLRAVYRYKPRSLGNSSGKLISLEIGSFGRMSLGELAARASYIARQNAGAEESLQAIADATCWAMRRTMMHKGHGAAKAWRALGTIIHAYGEMNFPCERLLELSANRIREIQPGTTPQQLLIQFAFGYTVHHQDHQIEPVWRELFRQPLQTYSWRQQHKLFHLAAAASRAVPRSWQPVRDAHWRASEHEGPSSFFEHTVLNEIGDALVRSGLSVELLVRQVALMGYVVDGLIEYQQRKWIIECDGAPFHIAGGSSGGKSPRQLGRDLIKERVLRGDGHQVVRVGSERWQSLDSEGRSAWVNQIVATIVRSS